MRAYVIRRVLLLIPTFFLLTILVFLSVRFIPGDAVDTLLHRMEDGAGGGTHIDRAELEQRLELDVPVPVQYGRWIGGILLRGDLGQPLLRAEPVGELIAGRLPTTIELGLVALIVGLLIGVPIGIYSAVRQDTVGDYVGRSFAVFGLATPNFWLATIVLIYPAVWWAWSPPLRLVRLSDDFVGHFGIFIVPGLILGTYLAAGARAAPWPRRWEEMFAIPGLGRLMIGALIDRDYPLISGINLFFAAAVMIINLLVDVLYAYLDPRVQYG